MNQLIGGSLKYVIGLTLVLLMVTLFLSAMNLAFLFQLQDRVENTKTTINNINETIGHGSRLVMIWNNSRVGFNPEDIGTNYVPAYFSYNVSQFRRVYIYYWLASPGTVSNWNVGFSTKAFQISYVASFTISSSFVNVLALDAQATYLNVTLQSYSGGVEGYLSLYLYLV